MSDNKCSTSNSSNPFRVGDKVTIKPQWQDEGDELFERTVIEAPENSDRVFVQTDIPEFAIKPSQWIPTQYLNKAVK